MNCARVRSHLGDHLEGDLEIRFRARVDEHLERCASCAEELSALRSTVALVRSLPEFQPPAELSCEIMRRIEAGEGRIRRTPAVIRYLFAPQVAAALAAGLAAFAIFTSVETSWVETPEVVAVAPPEVVGADQEAIDMWEQAPITIATAKAIEPRLAAIERTAANRFYRPDPRNMVVGFYGRVDPDSQQLDLDGQLERAKLDPRGFLNQLNEIAEPERRSRVAPLVVRAGRRGDAHAVARSLRDTSHPLANTLAAEFDRKQSNPAANPMVVPASY
ncbi:MAG: zf-HC2 domain-containing protein [Deltaproteobacteria bacterium]|nr:zf-HC2 domain-containing protein [Deltaproteobacteria bacterium]MBW2542992.1 zf-HC2 domain-containing protein [Deltaproteobacteria bacterium]